MLRLSQQQASIRVISDQFGCPTYSGHIAEAIFDLINIYIKKRSLPWGVYHIADKDSTNWYEFACSIFQRKSSLFKNQPKIIPISTLQFPTKANTAQNSVLDCQKLEKLLNRSMQKWKHGLDTMLIKRATIRFLQMEK